MLLSQFHGGAEFYLCTDYCLSEGIGWERTNAAEI
jgi:hypothetical protein